MRRMRALRLDAAIDMEFFARGSAIIAFLSGARARVGFHTWYAAGPYRGDLFTHRLLYNPHLHTTSMFQVLVESLRSDPADLPTLDLPPPSAENTFAHFVPRPGEVEPVEAMLPRRKRPAPARHPAQSQRQRPGAACANGRPAAMSNWPAASWPNFPKSTSASPAARGKWTQIKRLAARGQFPRCICLAGRTTLRQLMVLYTLCEVLVTNDSGPAHFASLTSIHVITLFGPETPALFAARTPRNLAFWAGIACSPCVNANNNRQSPCRNNLCMQHISVDQVFGEVCRVYTERRQLLAV